MTDEVRPALLATTIDCVDLEPMAAFYGALLGVHHQILEPFAFLAPTEGRRATIWLQRVPEQRVGKNRLHLDFVVHDLDAACHRVEELGGALGAERRWQDFHWRTCTDLEGNAFDLMQAQAPPTDPS
ncbi:MAG: VOC family protein [Actinomycetota bacterium]